MRCGQVVLETTSFQAVALRPGLKDHLSGSMEDRKLTESGALVSISSIEVAVRLISRHCCEPSVNNRAKLRFF